MINTKEKIGADEKKTRFSLPRGLSRESIFSSTTSASTALDESFVSLASSTGEKSSCFEFLSHSYVKTNAQESKLSLKAVETFHQTMKEKHF